MLVQLNTKVLNDMCLCEKYFSKDFFTFKVYVPVVLPKYRGVASPNTCIAGAVGETWDEEMLFRPSDSFQSSQKHSFSAAQGLLYKNNKQLLQRHVIASHNSREINDIIIWTVAMGNND